MLPDLPVTGWEYREDIDRVANINHPGLSLAWYYNGERIDPDFVAKRSDMNMDFRGNSVEFDLSGTLGHDTLIEVETEKAFPEGYFHALEEAWGNDEDWKISDLNTMAEKTAIIVINNPNIKSGDLEISSIDKFFASTLINAPLYLIFSVRLAIAVVLVWFLLFGFSKTVRLD